METRGDVGWDGCVGGGLRSESLGVLLGGAAQLCLEPLRRKLLGGGGEEDGVVRIARMALQAAVGEDSVETRFVESELRETGGGLWRGSRGSRWGYVGGLVKIE